MWFSMLRGGNKSLGDMLRDRHAPTANTAATKTIAAAANKKNILHKIVCSYDNDPTGGSIKVESPVGTVVWGPHAITHSGPCLFTLSPLVCAENVAMKVLLAAGGNGVTGVLDFDYSTEQD